MDRREILKWAGSGAAFASVPAGIPMLGAAVLAHPAASTETFFDVRRCGATGDGKTLDTKAIQNAIDRAERVGGGRVLFPAGTYASYSIHLKSNVALYLDQGATLLAASVPLDGTSSGGYGAAEPLGAWGPAFPLAGGGGGAATGAEPQGAWEPYQDYGHNHWHNSLLWGENIHDVSVIGPGLLWGRGLEKGDGAAEEKPGAAN